MNEFDELKAFVDSWTTNDGGLTWAAGDTLAAIAEAEAIAITAECGDLDDELLEELEYVYEMQFRASTGTEAEAYGLAHAALLREAARRGLKIN